MNFVPKSARELYRERAWLVAFVAALYPSVRASNDPYDDRSVVYVQTSAGQLSWHVDSADMDLFPHVPLVTGDDPRAQWDHHSTSEKYRRLTQLTVVTAADQFDFSGLHADVDADFVEDRAALFDAAPDQAAYRYLLECRWSSEPPALWIMLNLSVETARVDDPTIRRVKAFSRRFDTGGFQVVNLFALRSTDPAALVAHPDPVGEYNDEILARFARGHRGPVIVAWGAAAGAAWAADRVDRVLGLLAEVPLYCLGLTGDGHPRHPLYLAANTPLCTFRSSAGGES